MTTPENKAHVEIDRQLEQCGSIVQNHAEMNIYAGFGRSYFSTLSVRHTSVPALL